MALVPETRASLILRLKSSDDADAWREFVAIYGPFVYRFARRSGFQDVDAHELVQNVLLAVVKAIDRWQYDSERARFRSWLFTIARNQLMDLLRKKRGRPIASGSSGIAALLDRQPARDDSAEQLAVEHRQTLLLWAASRVKGSVKEATWRAFWMTSVEGHSVAEAARSLGLTHGAVYIARSRVASRLRDEVRQLEADHAL
jgi:RNA polymerase sigma factor (sigma-70 family)